jgi:hypothetical protein
MSVLEKAQFLQAVAVVVGVVVAVFTIYMNARIQREQTARNAYIKYIELAFQHPQFSSPNWEKFDFDKESFSLADHDPKEKKELQFEQYEWFVSVMMNTAHLVFTTTHRDPVLQDLMILQIAYHWKYIDHFKTKRKYLEYRHSQYKKQIDEGVRLGKRGAA